MHDTSPIRNRLTHVHNASDHWKTNCAVFAHPDESTSLFEDQGVEPWHIISLTSGRQLQLLLVPDAPPSKQASNTATFPIPIPIQHLFAGIPGNNRSATLAKGVNDHSDRHTNISSTKAASQCDPSPDYPQAQATTNFPPNIATSSSTPRRNRIKKKMNEYSCVRSTKKKGVTSAHL